MGWLEVDLDFTSSTKSESVRLVACAWKIAHELLQVAKRSNCSRCLGQREDALHVIKAYRDSKEAWNSFCPSLMLREILSLNLKEWMVLNQNYRRQTTWGARWPKIMAIICWNLWRWENANIFEKEALPLSLKLEHIRRSFKETEQAWRVHSIHRGGGARCFSSSTEKFVVFGLWASLIHQKRWTYRFLGAFMW